MVKDFLIQQSLTRILKGEQTKKQKMSDEN